MIDGRLEDERQKGGENDDEDGLKMRRIVAEAGVGVMDGDEWET